MMMKVVSFTGGAAGVYAGLRAIVTGNASGEIPFAQVVIFVWLLIIFASSWRLAGAIFNSKRIAQGGVYSVRRMNMKLRDLLSDENKKRLNASAAKNEQLSRKDWEEIMGVQRDIYKRVNGRFRRK